MKTVILMRGIPGSGKSSYVKVYYGNATVCSADEFFVTPEGEYSYDRGRIGLAHRHSWEKFEQALRSGDALVVVDNTNLSVKRLLPYIQTARNFGYVVTVVNLWCDPHVAARRNVHGVPLPKVIDMYRAMCDVLVPSDLVDGIKNVVTSQSNRIPQSWHKHFVASK